MYLMYQFYGNCKIEEISQIPRYFFIPFTCFLKSRKFIPAGGHMDQK